MGVPVGAGGGLAAAFLAVLIWGGQLPVAKSALALIDGFSINLVRYGVAAVAFVLVLRWREGWSALKLDRAGAAVALAGGAGLAAATTFMFAGLALTRPEIAVLITAMQPAMSALAQWLVHRHAPPRVTLWCMAVAFFGVLMAATRGGAVFVDAGVGSQRELLGNALMLIACISWVVYMMASTRVTGWSVLRLSAVTSVQALLILIPVWLIAWLMGLVRIEVDEWAATSWRLGYLSLVGVVIGMFLWNDGARRAGMVNAMLLLNLMPVITFAIRALEGARFEAIELAGGALVVGALMVNSWSLRRSAGPLH